MSREEGFPKILLLQHEDSFIRAPRSVERAFAVTEMDKRVEWVDATGDARDR